MECSFECAVCFKRFKQKRYLYNHVIKEKHSISNNLPSEELQVTLPSRWKYGNYKFSDTCGKSSSFSMYIYDLTSKSDVVTWMNSYMEKNGFRFICRTSASKNGKLYIDYRCEHHQDANRETKKKKKVKGTGCQSAVYFILKGCLAEVRISEVQHNHAMDSSAVLPFLKPTAEVERIFMAMFNNGLRPGEALSSFKNHVKLQLEDDIEYLKFSADRSKMPDYNWVRHLYHKNFSKRNDFISAGNVEELKQWVKKINNEFSAPVCSFLEIDANNNFAIAIVTPFMSRISAVNSSGELAFFDSVGYVERLGLRVFLISARMKAGGVPLGILMSTDETERVIQEALNQFLQYCTQNSFGGRGKSGPLYFITTDDCESGIVALSEVFPDSKQFLCTFHVLQSTYRWLTASVNSITLTERDEIYRNIKKMVYADSDIELDTIYNYLVNKYRINQRLIRYLSTLYKKKEKWCLFYRRNTLLPGLNTNNIGESALRMLKRNILHRIISQTPVQLLQYLVHDYEEFCKETIISKTFEKSTDTLNDEGKSQINYRYFFTADPTESMVTVISRETNAKYSVNIDVGVCSCYAGSNGGYCKHQQFLDGRMEIINHPLPKATNESSKFELFYLVTGSVAVPPENFFSSPNHEAVEIEFISNEATEDLRMVETYFSDESANEQQDRKPLTEEGKCEIQNFKKNINRLIDIMEEDPEMYVGALKSCNKNLVAAANVPNAIISSLYSFNTGTSRCNEEEN